MTEAKRKQRGVTAETADGNGSFNFNLNSFYHGQQSFVLANALARRNARRYAPTTIYVRIGRKDRSRGSTPGRQREDKIADRELCGGLLAENCVIKRGGGLEMEKESEDKKLRKGFREEEREVRGGGGSVLSCLR